MCDERLPIIEDIADAKHYQFSLLIVRELDTHVGYVKLQLVINGVPCMNPMLCNIFKRGMFKMDEKGRMVLSDFPNEELALPCIRHKNKPALKAVHINREIVQSLRCMTWPCIAQEWLSRRRLYRWPTEDTIEEVRSFGFFVIKKGHPFSSEIDLEWRVSLSLQERKLMFDLSDIQYKCYFILKMFNRDIIKMDNITSYHWKTCLFYVLEGNHKNVWTKERLYHSVKLCMRQMLEWVQNGFCPNYFIPMDNLFDGKLNKNQGLIFANKLKKLLVAGFDCFHDVKSDNIGDYLRSSQNAEKLHELQEKSKDVYDISLTMIDYSFIINSRDQFDHIIIDQYYYPAFEDILTFIKLLWATLDRMQRICTVTEHTAEETKSSLSVLIPYVYESLASNISAMAIHHPNLQVRYFLLFGSFIYFLEGNLLGRLKLISVLYAIGLYKDSEYFLNRENEQYMTYNQSMCACRCIRSNQRVRVLDAIPDQSNICTCVSFLSSELPIIPDAMKYELFRHTGISMQHKKGRNPYTWLYKAIVDFNIYYFFLKYLIKGKLRRFQESEAARGAILNLVRNKYVTHSDVAYNLLAWTYNTQLDTPMVLTFLTRSWQILNPLEILYVEYTDEMKRTFYQFNAAKLHALILLYNTWFAKKPSSVHFCFKCFSVSQVKLQKCSKCKISTYCSKKCQEMNWKIHKLVCKIVRSYKST